MKNEKKKKRVAHFSTWANEQFPSSSSSSTRCCCCCLAASRYCCCRVSLSPFPCSSTYIHIIPSLYLWRVIAEMRESSSFLYTDWNPRHFPSRVFLHHYSFISDSSRRSYTHHVQWIIFIQEEEEEENKELNLHGKVEKYRKREAEGNRGDIEFLEMDALIIRIEENAPTKCAHFLLLFVVSFEYADKECWLANTHFSLLK